MELPIRSAFRFVPSDEELISFLYEKVHGVTTTESSDSPVLYECDFYADKEPWQIWNDYGGSQLNKGEDLYFFTKLKKLSITGSRSNRRTSSGTWNGVNCVPVGSGGLANRRYFKYKNRSGTGSESDVGWKMYEYSLVHGGADPYVLCRLRREIKGQKRKLKNFIPTHNSSCSSSSSSSVGDHQHQQQRIKAQRVDAADDTIDFGFLFDSDEQDLNEIAREEHFTIAALNVIKPGIRFLPSDEDLVTYLNEKVYGGGEARTDRALLGECDMYGDKEPWNIWNDHGGSKLNIKAGEDLYFFTKLNKVSDVNGSRNFKRQVGSGTWSGAYCRHVAGGRAMKKHFSYENEGCREHHLAWIMHEYSLDDPRADYVLCRLRKKPNKNMINNKNTRLVNDQEIIKKQRLGVESEYYENTDQVLEKILPVCLALNKFSEEEVMNGTENFVEIDDGTNNFAKSSSTSTTAVQNHGDQIIISEDDNDALLKSTFETYEELEELEKIMPLSYSPLNMFREEEVMNGIVMDIDYQATNNHGTAGADDLSQPDMGLGTIVELLINMKDSHMEETEEHSRFANNNVAKSTSEAACDELDLKEISREDYVSAAAVAKSSSSTYYDHMEVAEGDDEYLNGVSFAQLLKDIPLYYVEADDDHDNVSMDTVVDL